MNGCRSCGGAELVDVLDLGVQPLANDLADSPRGTQERFRLNLVFCRSCGLVQIDETVPAGRLFTEYVYRSSFSDSMLAHVRALTDRVVERRGLGSDSLVIEAGSNDGYLLQYYLARDIPVLGVEPAANIARIARSEKKIPTEVAFFGDAVAEDLAARFGRCDVFHAHNVIAHVSDPNAFLKGVATILKPDGIAIIEAPYVRDLVDGLEFDTIYHEHLSYFGVTAFARLARRNSLALIDVERIPIHGGSVRYSLGPEVSRVSPAVEAILHEEAELGVATFEYYESFAGRVEALCRTLREWLRGAKAGGASLAAYGASAKGSTLLNTLGVGAETLDFTVDRNPLKQGRYMPGAMVPILPPTALLEKMPDYVLLLTWNFADEIIGQQRAYLERGGRFVLPVPAPRIIGIDETSAVAALDI